MSEVTDRAYEDAKAAQQRAAERAEPSTESPTLDDVEALHGTIDEFVSRSYRATAHQRLDRLTERLQRAEGKLAQHAGNIAYGPAAFADARRYHKYHLGDLDRIESLETALQLAQGALREIAAEYDERGIAGRIARKALPPTSPTGEEGS